MKINFSFLTVGVLVLVFCGVVLGAFFMFSFPKDGVPATLSNSIPADDQNALVAAQIREPGMPDVPAPVALSEAPKAAAPSSPVVKATAKKIAEVVSPVSSFVTDDSHCFTGGGKEYPCLAKYYAAFVKAEGPEAASAFVQKRYKSGDGFYISQCHQITHMIGRAAANLYPNVGEAYRHGDSFCWSGYYHGVMEGILAQIGPSVMTKLDSICVDIPGKATYSFDYYNCVHGLGHGLMYILDNELFEVLERCNNLTGWWEQSSCHGGAFMENIIADEVNHKAKYLRADDPHYPCNQAKDTYKSTCYLMQTSRMLTLAGGNFAAVFEQCKGAGVPYIDTCYQSLGRDASGRSVSNAEQTRATCMLGPDEQARVACVRGAAMDFISYHHSDVQAKELCASLETGLQSGCYATVESYYKRF